jgi:hypothetical protein
MKANVRPAPVTEARPKAVDLLTSVTEQVLTFRYGDRQLTLADLARVISSASRLLRFGDMDERIETENKALMELARKRQLVS